MTEMTPEVLPQLQVGVNVPERDGESLDEVTVEMSLDEHIILILAFPNDGFAVDRVKVAQLFLIAGQAWPEILNQMEAQPSE